MTTRRAACSCGQLQLTCEGEPLRISICHCLECQLRTGAAFGYQARFDRRQIAISGNSSEFTRSSDSGKSVTFRFCPVCGSTVYWQAERFPDFMSVAAGAFADPAFAAPTHAVYERRRHPWLAMLGGMPLEHSD